MTAARLLAVVGRLLAALAVALPLVSGLGYLEQLMRHPRGRRRHVVLDRPAPCSSATRRPAAWAGCCSPSASHRPLYTSSLSWTAYALGGDEAAALPAGRRPRAGTAWVASWAWLPSWLVVSTVLPQVVPHGRPLPGRVLAMVALGGCGRPRRSSAWSTIARHTGARSASSPASPTRSACRARRRCWRWCSRWSSSAWSCCSSSPWPRWSSASCGPTASSGARSAGSGTPSRSPSWPSSSRRRCGPTSSSCSSRPGSPSRPCATGSTTSTCWSTARSSRCCCSPAPPLLYVALVGLGRRPRRHLRGRRALRRRVRRRHRLPPRAGPPPAPRRPAVLRPARRPVRPAAETSTGRCARPTLRVRRSPPAAELVRSGLRLPGVGVVVPHARRAVRCASSRACCPAERRHRPRPARTAGRRAAGRRPGRTRRADEPAPTPARTRVPPGARRAAGVGGVRRCGCPATSRSRARRLVAAREDERRRLRRDLHDGLGPLLAGVVMGLDVVRSAIARGDTTGRPSSPLPPASRPARPSTTCAASCRASAAGPRRPRARGGAALHRPGRGGGRPRGVHRCRRRPRRAARRRSRSRPTGSSSEAMTNAVRHADACTVDVLLRATTDALVVRVEDDGAGIRPRRRRRGGPGLDARTRRRARRLVHGHPLGAWHRCARPPAHDRRVEHRRRAVPPGVRHDRPRAPACASCVVDDHPVFRQGLRTLLEDLGVEVVAEAADGESRRRGRRRAPARRRAHGPADARVSPVSRPRAGSPPRCPTSRCSC